MLVWLQVQVHANLEKLQYGSSLHCFKVDPKISQEAQMVDGKTGFKDCNSRIKKTPELSSRRTGTKF